MPVNPYFNQTTWAAEQNLVEDLIIEAIAIYGHEVYYLKRDDVDIDTLLGEDTLAKFTTAVNIEMYIKTVESFQGQSEFMSKFGLQIEDQATFVVAARRFNQTIVPATGLLRPREGDLIYIQMTPNNRYIFEIRFVENKEQLFQLGNLYTYELRCEMMNYAHERVSTGMPEIDAVADTQAFTVEIALGPGNGTFLADELVYQGDSFVTAAATASVYEHNTTTNTLLVQNVTGAFNNTGMIVGMTSSASYLPAGNTPSTAPNDPVSDNDILETESTGVVVNRGTNPLITG